MSQKEKATAILELWEKAKIWIVLALLVLLGLHGIFGTFDEPASSVEKDAESVPKEAMELVAIWTAILLVLSVPTLLLISYFKARRRRIGRPSTGGAPVTLPQPGVEQNTLPMYPSPATTQSVDPTPTPTRGCDAADQRNG